MTNPFESTAEFAPLFDLESRPEYHDQIIFTDGKIGFSIKRNYPENIRYKPPVKRDNTPDNVVIIWVGYTHHRETNKNIDLNKNPTPEGPVLVTPGRGYFALTLKGPRMSCPQL